MVKTYKCRTKISKAGHKRLGVIFSLSAELYNAGLESRIDCYKKTGKGRSFFDQCKELTELRAELREFEEVSAIVFRGVLSRLDKAYKRFFQYGGFPRFKSSRRWRTIEINDQCWHMLKRERQKLVLKIKGLPRIKVKTERELPPNSLLKTIRITRKPLRTEVALSYELPTPEAESVSNSVGIDMGISKRLTLSNGETAEKRELDRKRLIRLQRSVSRKVKGSNNRRKAVSLLAKEWQRLTDKERNYLHRLTSEIVKMYNFIAIEKLETKKMLGNKQLAKSIQEQTWGKFAVLLNEKAESAGVTVVAVNPEGTSQECSSCGAEVKKSLSTRVHKCNCGLVLDRDVNAAINILHRGISVAGGNVTRMVGRMKDKQGVGLARPRTIYKVANFAI